MMVEGTKILTTWTWEGQTFCPHGYDTAGQGRHGGHRARGAIREGALCPITADFAAYQRSRDGAEVSVMYAPRIRWRSRT